MEVGKGRQCWQTWVEEARLSELGCRPEVLHHLGQRGDIVGHKVLLHLHYMLGWVVVIDPAVEEAIAGSAEEEVFAKDEVLSHILCPKVATAGVELLFDGFVVLGGV